MQIPQQFSEQLSLPQQVVYVLSIVPRATADEVAMELMELNGITTRDGVADLTHDVEETINKLCREQVLKVVPAATATSSYCLVKDQ